jgi:hypothetical protein
MGGQMPEEQKVVAPETQQKEEPKVEVEKAKEMTFTQSQLDNIIKSRLEAEQRKHQRTLEDTKKKEEDAAKEKLVKEAKSKAELEKLMQQRISEKDTEILKYKNEIKKERIDNSIMAVASKNNAINPSQVVSLLKDAIKLNDDGRVEILDNNSNIRYNEKGNLLTIEEKVKEFLQANPHFSASGKSGTGSQSSVEGKTVKPFNIQDLDMSKEEDRAKYAEYRKKRDNAPTQINVKQ